MKVLRSALMLFKEIEKAIKVRLRTHLEQGINVTVQSSGREILGVVKSDTCQWMLQAIAYKMMSRRPSTNTFRVSIVRKRKDSIKS